MTKEKPEEKDPTKKWGSLIPDSTSDDTDTGWSEESSDRDEEIRRDVPPHH